MELHTGKGGILTLAFKNIECGNCFSSFFFFFSAATTTATATAAAIAAATAAAESTLCRSMSFYGFLSTLSINRSIVICIIVNKTKPNEGVVSDRSPACCLLHFRFVTMHLIYLQYWSPAFVHYMSAYYIACWFEHNCEPEDGSK